MSEQPTVTAGMSEPGFHIGRFTLRNGYGGYDKVWVETGGGEGADFSAADLEALIAAYYKENF